MATSLSIEQKCLGVTVVVMNDFTIRMSDPEDLPRIIGLLQTRGWDDSNTLERPTWFIAEQDGEVIGCAQTVEVAPGHSVVDQVLVREDERERGVGRALLEAIMESRDDAMFLCCHDDRLRFYGHFGFADMGIDLAPPAVRDYWMLIEDYPAEDGHVHYYLRAR